MHFACIHGHGQVLEVLTGNTISIEISNCNIICFIFWINLFGGHCLYEVSNETVAQGTLVEGYPLFSKQKITIY